MNTMLLLLLLLLQFAAAAAAAEVSPAGQVQPSSSVQPSSCSSELARLCSGARGASSGNCLVCAGTHQQQLMQASCNNPTIEAWCSRVGPSPPPPPACRVTQGVECKQPRHYDGVEAADAGQCCGRCGDDRRCQFWTFKASDVGSGHPCQRFASMPVVNKSSGSFVSGSAPAVRPPPPPTSKVRLRVSGAKVLGPQGDEVRLVGFNWQLNHVQRAPFRCVWI